MQIAISKSNCVILFVNLVIITALLFLLIRTCIRYSSLKTRVIAVRNSASVEAAGWEEL
ncbi:hypothetical protein [Fig virus B]|nr:hypothetical protein [Fig virus B]